MFHELSGKFGWSKLHVARVTKISYTPRLFCIFDRDRPYTLSIEYEEPTTTTNTVIDPVITFGGHFGVTWREKQHTDWTQTITVRLDSAASCEREMYEILRKQASLNLLTEKFAKEAHALIALSEIKEDNGPNSGK